MRVRFLTLGLIGAGLLTGCGTSHKPFANNPLLLYYKPTLSDSETVLADRAARRGPTQPPMPALAAEAPKEPAPGLLLKQPSADPLVPVKLESAPTDIRPIIRQSSGTSDQTPAAPAILKVSAAQPPLYDGLKPILVSTQTGNKLPEPTVAKKIDAVDPAKPVDLIAQKPLPAPAAKRQVTGRFGHDADYRWLQGVVEKNDHGHDAIRYCDPSADDEYGGKFAIDDSRLSAFRDGDVIGVEGELAAESAGKTRHRTYNVREVWLVKGRE